MLRVASGPMVLTLEGGYTKDGVKFFEWENAKDLSKYGSMASEQVTSALSSSNYLTKWVD